MSFDVLLPAGTPQLCAVHAFELHLHSFVSTQSLRGHQGYSVSAYHVTACHQVKAQTTAAGTD